MLEPGHKGHGWGWFDHDHWSTDLLFDYWSVTGDEWAKEELRQLGESLKGLMRLRNYGTSFVQSARAEGWTMQSFVQIYLATGDPNIRAYALRRVHEVVNPGRQSSHPSRALTFQGNYPGTLFGGNTHRFFMPWQHGPVLYGYLAAYRFFRDPTCLRIAEDVITTVDYSWVRNYRDRKLGLITKGLRYYVPVELNGTAIPANYFDFASGVGVRWGDSPLGGAHIFLVGGLHLLADVTGSDQVRGKALYFATSLRGNLNSPSNSWSKWWAAVPPRYAR